MAAESPDAPEMTMMAGEGSCAENTISDYFKCVNCQHGLGDVHHRRMTCGHKVCGTCYAELKSKHNNENVVQCCPLDGIKFSFEHNYSNESKAPRNEFDIQSESLSKLSTNLSRQHKDTDNVTLDFRDVENNLIASKQDDEKLIELIQNRIAHTKKTRQLIETTVAGLEAVQKDANDDDLSKFNRTAKIEKREATSLRTQWSDLHRKAEESRKKYKEKYCLALNNLNKARDLITRLTDESEGLQMSQPSPRLIISDDRTGEDCPA